MFQGVVEKGEIFIETKGEYVNLPDFKLHSLCNWVEYLLPFKNMIFLLTYRIDTRQFIRCHWFTLGEWINLWNCIVLLLETEHISLEQELIILSSIKSRTCF